jgi:hypothetical protein
VQIHANTTGLISAFYLEIEHLLDRLERATTHYQALSVSPTATTAEINDAYEKAVVLLQPPEPKVREALPEELRSRIGEAFAKLSEAYDTLNDKERRAIYDGAAIQKSSYLRVQPLHLAWPKPPAPQSDQPRASNDEVQPKGEPAAVQETDQTINIRVFHEQERAFVKASDEAAARLRRCERFKLSVPVLITGYERGGRKWKEVSKTLDVSRVGAAVKMSRRVKHGVIVHLILPLPTRLRSHGFTEPSYNTFAIVRRVQQTESGMRLVGLEFIGAHPPRDFLDRPWGTFRTQSWTGLDRRREPRKILVERIEVEYLDGSRTSLGKETAVTENVSASGSRIRVKNAPAEFDWVLVKSQKRGFESLAVLRNQYVGKDGIDRLCLQFVENKWPDVPMTSPHDEHPAVTS